MSIAEAHRITSARLGPALHHVARGGPAADEWLVQAVPPTGPLLSARAASIEEAIGEAEAQLRAAGWVPTHPRLVWRRNQIVMMFGALAFPVVTVVTTGEEVAVLIHPSVTAWMYFPDMSTAYARISEWCAANLPSLHLPHFPENPHAS